MKALRAEKKSCKKNPDPFGSGFSVGVSTRLIGQLRAR